MNICGFSPYVKFYLTFVWIFVILPGHCLWLSVQTMQLCVCHRILMANLKSFFILISIFVFTMYVKFWTFGGFTLLVIF